MEIIRSRPTETSVDKTRSCDHPKSRSSPKEPRLTPEGSLKTHRLCDVYEENIPRNTNEKTPHPMALPGDEIAARLQPITLQDEETHPYEDIDECLANRQDRFSSQLPWQPEQHGRCPCNSTLEADQGSCVSTATANKAVSECSAPSYVSMGSADDYQAPGSFYASQEQWFASTPHPQRRPAQKQVSGKLVLALSH